MNFPKLEAEILKFWEDNKIFEKSLEKTAPSSSPPIRGANRGRKSGGIFTFFDGPPFATGLPHYGHILASTIKDLIPRYQTMKGRYVRRRWGWDCHGLPIEEIVERELKISGRKEIEKIGIKKFNETCRSMVLQYVAEWKKMVRRIARWTEFDNSYKTMDRDYMESVWWAFKEIYNKGLVYEGRKVLLYCPRCETPISNFEVAMDNSYQDVTEEAVTVKFRIKTTPTSSPPILQSKTGGKREGVYLLAWTTTPWTLPGNVALAVGKDIDYMMFEKGGEYFITANTPLTSPLMRGERGGSRPHEGEKEGVLVNKLKGRDLVGLEYEPLFDIPALRPPLPLPPHQGEGIEKKNIPPSRWGRQGGGENDKVYRVYPADFVTTEEGTGIVHTAVVYGEDDYALGTKVGLPVVPLLDEKGRFNEQAPKLIRGQYFKDAERAIKKDLESRGLLFERKSHKHSYPHCWRCGTMLYYNAIPAWFIKISNIKTQILKSNQKEINWYPEHLKLGRYAKSVESAPDWNISRNRYWGNPIPVWKCEKCGKDTVIGSVEELRQKANNFDVIARSGATKQSHGKEIAAPRFGIGARNDRAEGIDLHRPYIDEVIIRCDFCHGNAKRITEIFDSWVEAGSMPFASVHWPFESPLPARLASESVAGRPNPRPNASGGQGGEVGGRFPFPAQFVAEYIAQTRAWFYVMHVVSVILFGKAPFENVVTTGTILAEDGSKMSKSKRNFPDPWAVIEKYGVDSLRFYLMNSVVMQADDLNFSERDLQNVNRKVVRILWNVYNYFVTYGNEARWVHNSAATITPSSPPHEGGSGGGVLDQWILVRLQELINRVTDYFDAYNTVPATKEIERFIDDLSTWYLRRSRGRNDSGFFETLHGVLIELSKVIAPVMPYISEAIYRNLANAPSPFSPPTGGEGKGGGKKVSSYYISVHLTDWPKARKLTLKERQLLEDMQGLRKIVEEVHALRAKAGVKLRQKLRELTIPHGSVMPDLIRHPESKGVGFRLGGRNDNSFYGNLLDILKSEVNVQEVVEGDKLELDTTITPELKIEGLARELERQIQSLRKESGLKIGQMADLYYETESDIIKQAFEKVDRNKTYLKNIEYGVENGEGKEIEIGGERVKISCKRKP